MYINFISGSSQVDGDGIVHMITFETEPRPEGVWPIAADQEKAVRGGLR